MIDNVRLLDIDNCIADDAWRIPRIQWSLKDPFLRYHAYHQLSPWDRADNHDLFRDCGERIVLLTSRPEYYRPLTVEWLRREGVVFEALMMRSDNDFGNSLAVKEAQLMALLHPAGFGHLSLRRDNIASAFDDRPEIVAMYRAHGVRAEVRAIHQTCAYTDPVNRVNHANGAAL